MTIDSWEMEKIRNLVGNITEQHLKYVDWYVSEDLGIFIPSVGFCEYAIMPRHLHPAYSFMLFFNEKQSLVPIEINMKPAHYLVEAISPDVPHEENKTESFTRYIAIFVSKELYESQFKLYCDRPIGQYLWKQLLVSQNIMNDLKKFMCEYEDRFPGYEKVLEGLSTIITHQLIRGLLNISSLQNPVIDQLDIEEIIEYMHQNFGEKLSIDRLAKHINMSKSHFIRIFKKEVKLTPSEYLMKIRMDKAKKLLRSKSKTVTEVALQCGFNSNSHFSSYFSKQMGITPSEYQNNYGSYK